jgi:hypothetical protein
MLDACAGIPQKIMIAQLSATSGVIDFFSTDWPSQPRY